MSIFRTAQMFTLGVLASLTWFCSAPTRSHANPTWEPASDLYSGEWVSPDQTVRQRLLPNHRYEERHGSTVYRGTYRIRDQHIEYWDDAGFVADGDFVNGSLHQSGIVLVRDSQANLLISGKQASN